MTLTVVGSIAFDAVRTPFGERERMLGGSAVHFSLAASFFCDVRIVGPVGEDFGEEEYAVLHARAINTDDIERVLGGRTFFWRGHYDYDLNTAHTEATELNVFASFEPKLSPASREAEFLFLANIQPDLQRQVREQCTGARFSAMDSMNLWIDTARDSLVRTIGAVNAVLLNDAELRVLTGEPNLLRAARAVLAMGPSAVVAKRGEYGAMLFTADHVFSLPAYPLETVLDPTGAGDSFAGAFLGYLGGHAGGVDDVEALKRAVAYGTAMASFNVEEFGTERVRRLSGEEIAARVAELERMTRFSDLPAALRG
ncbi:MAG: PfkB family carbohydrate kinase [Solirubrobacteraceae bacterium]|nr:MAG: sugar kinase [Solirubrobacterales bacterium]